MAVARTELLRNQPPPLPQPGDNLLRALKRTRERRMSFLVWLLAASSFVIGISVSGLFGRYVAGAGWVGLALIGGMCLYDKFFLEKRSDEERRCWELGRQGEMVTADYLNEFAVENGFRVLHSVPGDGEFDVDHVVFSEFGIWVLDSTVLSCKGGHEVTYDGRDIGGAVFGKEKLEQVRAGTAWLSDRLRKLTGRDFPVRGCLCVPGAFVRGSFKGDVWVMNPKAFGKSVLGGRRMLGREDMLLAYESVKVYVRSRNVDWYKG